MVAQGRPRRPRQHPLRDRDPPGAQARAERRARRGALAPARAPADRRRRARRAPNAGKSTLLAALTAATPKIAAYPFTTLEPNLGVMDLGVEDGRRPTIADVPGLIEGASCGRRPRPRLPAPCRADAGAAPRRGRRRPDPAWDHAVIRDELEAHDPALLEKPMLVVFNKLDLAAAARGVARLPGGAATRPGPASSAISADEGEGLDELRAAVADLLPDARGARGAARARRRRRPPPRGGRGRLHDRARGRGVPRPRQARRAAHRPDELRERGVRRALPARAPPDGDRRGTAARPGSAPATRSGSPRTSWSGSRRRTTSDVGSRDDRATRAPWCRARWGSSAGRSTRSTTGISRSPRRRARRWASRSSGSCRRPCRRFKPDRAVTAAGHRLAMVEAAIAGNPAFEASRVELDRRGPVVHGGDARGAARPRATPTPGSSCRRRRWRGSRAGASRTASSSSPGWRWSRGAGSSPLGEAWVGSQFPGREDRFAFLPGPLLPISGSVVRRRAAAGRSVRYLVPEAVAAYIAEHRLYAEPA